MKRFVPRGYAAIPLAGALLHLGGMLLKGPPADPDRLMPWTAVAGTFLIFIFWVLSVLGWGRWMNRRLGASPEGEPYLVCALGTLSVSALMMVLGFIGCIHPACAPVAILLLYMGLLGGWSLPPSAPASISFWKRFRPRGWALLPALVLAATAVLYGTKLASLNRFTDPMYYHLLAPRYWSQAGRITFFPDHPLLLQSTTWEMLYLWPCVLLGGPEASGVIEIHYFAQWTHFMLGWGTVFLALQAFLGEFETESAALWSALVAALACPGMVEFAPIANNDWGVASWEIAGLALALRESMRSGGNEGPASRWVAAGLLVGWGLAGKFTTAFFVAPALVALIWANASRREVKARFSARLVPFLTAIAAGLAPILARNAIFTGNPFFPALDQWFRTPWLPLSLRSYLALYEGGLRQPSLYALSIRTFSLFMQNPLIGLLPLIWIARSKPRPRKALALVLTVFWIAFGLFNREAENRLSGAGILILQAAGVLSAFWLFPKGRWARPGQAALTVLCAVWIAISWLRPVLRGWPDLPHESPAIAIRTRMMAGDGRAWLRMNTRPNDLILTTGDHLFYYVPHLRMVNIRYSAEWASILDRLEKPEDMVTVMRARSVRYLFDTDMTWEPGAVWGRESFLFQNLIERYPEALVFVSPTCRIIDLARLEDALSRACVYQSRRVRVPG